MPRTRAANVAELRSCDYCSRHASWTYLDPTTTSYLKPEAKRAVVCQLHADMMQREMKERNINIKVQPFRNVAVDAQD